MSFTYSRCSTPLLAIFLLLLLTGKGWCTVPIDHYESDIIIRKDGSLHIKETIRFTLEQESRVKDFSRRLPGLTWLAREAENDDSLEVEHHQIVHFLKGEFDHTAITPYFDSYPTEQICFPLGKNILSAGTHSLSYEYSIDGQVGYHEKEEWLNWNVTRNGFSSTISKVLVRVHLPPAIDITQVKGSGYGYIAPGATRDTVAPIQTGKHSLEFRSQAKLEGPRFKIGLTFPLHSFQSDYRRSIRYWETEYVRPTPGAIQKNRELLVGLGGFAFLLCLIFLLLPKKTKNALDQETLLKHYSPATIGYSIADKYHPGLFMASLLNLLKNKALYIEIDSKTNQLELEQDKNHNPVFDDEKNILNFLFATSNRIVTGQRNAEQVNKFKECFSLHERSISAFQPTKSTIPSLVILGLASIVVFAFIVLNVQTDMPKTELLGLSIVTIGFSLATLFIWLTSVIFPAFAAQSIPKAIIGLFSASTLFALLFTIPSITCVYYLVKQTGWLLILIFLSLTSLNLVFAFLPGFLQRNDKPLIAEAAAHLKENFLRDKIQVNSRNEYLHFLSLAYALNLQEHFIPQVQSNVFAELCPGEMNEKLWDEGSARSLFKRIRNLFL